MSEHLPPMALDHPEDATDARAVHHGVMANVNDLVDPFWMNEVLTRGYREFLYKQWSVDLAEVTPETVDSRLPDNVSLLRRSAALNSRKVQCVLGSEGALAAIQFVSQTFWIGVAGSDLPSAMKLLEAVEAAFPQAESAPTGDDSTVGLSVGLSIWGLHDESRSFRKLDVSSWDAIRDNYTPQTRETLDELMAPAYAPGRGQLLVWHGPPGTGKSFALGALAFAWRDWAAFTYIADPEGLLGDTSYLLEFMTLRDPHDRWRVAILEDTGELFGLDAHARTGQGLSRLLNATDGMLGKGSKTIFVITTNERIATFHPAVIRPGRCAALVSFEPLPVAQAKQWLVARGALDVAKRVREPVTVAELFAMVEGLVEPREDRSVGMYL